VRVLQGRVIHPGEAHGRALVSSEPLSLLGGIDAETGLVIDRHHPLSGQSVAGRVLIFPTGRGSTVGSYVLYQLKRNGLAPAAIINARCEPIVAVGAIISDIPAIDGIDISEIRSGDWVRIEEGGRIVVGS
jgi:predicted aconitase with swiveling domain